jgi:hypothetical protein
VRQWDDRNGRCDRGSAENIQFPSWPARVDVLRFNRVGARDLTDEVRPSLDPSSTGLQVNRGLPDTSWPCPGFRFGTGQHHGPRRRAGRRPREDRFEIRGCPWPPGAALCACAGGMCAMVALGRAFARLLPVSRVSLVRCLSAPSVFRSAHNRRKQTCLQEP